MIKLVAREVKTWHGITQSYITLSSEEIDKLRESLPPGNTQLKEKLTWAIVEATR